ncbi:hypothetical protein [Streptomyces sp. NPDC097610]|uniref:hypothetical protein n=1 Tax=Streptomyces sp. NPDC097610 TaxID=3157227 RepID=UPI00331D9D87
MGHAPGVMPRVLTAAADQLGDVERLALTCRPTGTVLVRGPIFPPERPSALVPAAAKALGRPFRTPAHPHSHKVQGVVLDVLVTAQATPATPEAPATGLDLDRKTTTAGMAAFVRELAPWAETVDWEQVLWFGLYDVGTTFEAGPAVLHSGLAELVVSTLPSQLDTGGIGPEGSALLPTGHTMRVVTAG